MASIENSEHGMPKHSGMADLIVKGAVALITAAFFVGAYLQLQLSFWSAFMGALSVYVILLMIHALMRRSEREKELVQELSRLESEVSRLAVAPHPAGTGPVRSTRLSVQGSSIQPHAPHASGPQFAAAPGASRMAPPPVPPSAPMPPRISRPAADAADKDGLSRSTDFRPGAHAPMAPAAELKGPAVSRPEPSLSIPPSVAAMTAPAQGASGMPGLGLHAAPAAADVPQMPTLPDWSAASAAPSSGAARMHDYWPGAGKPNPPEGPRVELSPLPAERETDLDAVHGMIKRLADEVNVAEPTLDGLPPSRQESVLRASLNALQTTANVMRATSQKKGVLPPLSAPLPGAPTPPPILPSHARLAALAEAVSAGRIEVTLSPIVGLADDQVHYYEVVACPRDERGMLLSTSTRDPQLAIAGLLPLLDKARLQQAATLARSFGEDGRETQLFTPASAVSLANDTFLDELADAYRDREALAGELVLTFAQADVRTFGSSEWNALTDMRDLGFRFGVGDVTELDYEFKALQAGGFAFVKMDAATLVAGLAMPNGTMSAEDICRSLSDLGLTLIVCNVDSEEMRARVLAAGVPLAQGTLFGPALDAVEAFAAAGDAAA